MDSEDELDKTSLREKLRFALHQPAQHCKKIDTTSISKKHVEQVEVYKRSSIQTRWHELFQPASMDAFVFEYDFVHVRAFTYILSWVLAKWYLQF